MAAATLPPGFRFHPTDEELVGYYLKRKVEGLEIELEVIPVVDLYKLDPWELPDKSFLPKRDMEWFFFCARDRKYPNGSRTNRATKSGYWKATGKDRKVACHSSVSGYRKTLVFYRGRAPLGTRTDWLMHEYRLGDDQTQPAPNFLGSFALCRVVKKNEQAQKGDCFGESKHGNVASSSNNGDETDEILPSGNLTSLESGQSSPSPYQVNPISDFFNADPTDFGFSSDFIFDSSKDYRTVEEPTSGFFSQYEFSSSAIPWPSQEIEHSDSFSQLEGFMSTGHGNFINFNGNDDVRLKVSTRPIHQAFQSNSEKKLQYTIRYGDRVEGVFETDTFLR